MKKVILVLIAIIGFSAIFLTGCQKEENVDVSGTKWKASISNGYEYVKSTLFFESQNSVAFTLEVNEYSVAETFPYKISGNIITMDTNPIWDNDFIFEKVGNSMYWTNYAGNDADIVLKYVKQ